MAVCVKVLVKLLNGHRSTIFIANFKFGQLHMYSSVEDEKNI